MAPKSAWTGASHAPSSGNDYEAPSLVQCLIDQCSHFLFKEVLNGTRCWLAPNQLALLY